MADPNLRARQPGYKIDVSKSLCKSYNNDLFFISKSYDRKQHIWQRNYR
jgi:hypothetical protein